MSTDQQTIPSTPIHSSDGNGSALEIDKNATDNASQTIPQALTSRRATPGRKRWVVLTLIAGAIVLGIFIGFPRVTFMLHHVTTDDATVNSHVTYLSSRVNGVATDVLVDDNQYVEKGTPLVQLDAEPFRIAVEQKQAALGRAKITIDQEVAALEVAQAELEQARTQVRGQLSGLRAAWYLVATVQDFVRYETAGLQSAGANLRQQKANLQLAEEEFSRVDTLGPVNASQEEIDRKKASLLVAREQVNTADAGVQQSRALLGLPQNAREPTTVPSDIGQTFNGTQYALASLQQSVAQLGLNLNDLPPAIGDLKNRLLSMSQDAIVEHSPAVLSGHARVNEARAALGGDSFNFERRYEQPLVVQAQRDLDQALLQQAYTTIHAPISGVVSRRYVNPGTHVQEGQNLLSIRSLDQRDIWIDANFKETQLADLRIGQAVELYVDAYPDHVFHGRVAGFSPGTGAVMSLLPPENATGNFVKVVQRLPVRIELTEPNPTETPLFAGLSVEPEVDIVAKPTGNDAGKRLLSAIHPVDRVGLASENNTGAVAQNPGMGIR
ncbi:MAG: efflux RND transporter periplasmic adaptor subunit [Planctomycetota bacterium]|nr:efflux RND transporter periplasmic adaptor subunit [Planctomycetota bacterium]